MVDDRYEVGLERAATLKAAEDLVVVLDEPQLDGGGEVLGIGPVQAAPHADPRDHPLDQREFGEKELLQRHGAPEDRSRAGSPGRSVGPMIRQVAAGLLGRHHPRYRSARVGSAAARHGWARRATVVPGAACPATDRPKALIQQRLEAGGGGASAAPRVRSPKVCAERRPDIGQHLLAQLIGFGIEAAQCATDGIGA